MLNERLLRASLVLVQFVQCAQCYVESFVHLARSISLDLLLPDRIAPVSMIAKAIRYCVYEFRIKAGDEKRPAVIVVRAAQVNTHLHRRHRTIKQRRLPKKPMPNSVNVPARNFHITSLLKIRGDSPIWLSHQAQLFST